MLSLKRLTILAIAICQPVQLVKAGPNECGGGTYVQPTDGQCEGRPLDAQVVPDVFTRVEGDLLHYDLDEIDFDYWVFEEGHELEDEVPETLPVPYFVRVFEFNRDQTSISFRDMGQAAREIIDDNLSSAGAVLFRNLHLRIANGTDFQEFWNQVRVSEEKGNWTYYPYDGRIGNVRNQIDGLDTTDSIDADELLSMHSEMAYNPVPCSKIMFYGVQDAIGGDTVLVRNVDMAKMVPDNVKPFFEAHGGVRHKKFFVNNTTPLSQDEITFKGEKPELSWQWAAGTQDIEEAIEFFLDREYKREDIIIHDNGDMEVSFVHPGYLVHPETGEDMWYNNQNHHSPCEMADGTKMPQKMIDELILAQWKCAYGLHLEQGDWLILDNFQVMHGRTPYERIRPDLPRTLYVVYTKGTF